VVPKGTCKLRTSGRSKENVYLELRRGTTFLSVFPSMTALDARPRKRLGVVYTDIKLQGVPVSEDEMVIFLTRPNLFAIAKQSRKHNQRPL
jgi:hypothetical protein